MPSKLTTRTVQALQPRERPYEERDSELTGLLLRVQPSGLKTFWYAYAFAGKRANRYRLGAFPGISIEGARTLAKAAAGARGQRWHCVGGAVHCGIWIVQPGDYLGWCAARVLGSGGISGWRLWLGVGRQDSGCWVGDLGGWRWIVLSR